MFPCRAGQPDAIRCNHVIEVTMPSCGHTLSSPCHQRQQLLEHPERCNHQVQLQLPACGHKVCVPCGKVSQTLLDPTSCTSSCEGLLPGCEHTCKAPCGSCMKVKLGLLPSPAGAAAARGGSGTQQQVAKSVADVFVSRLATGGLDLGSLIQGPGAPFSSWMDLVRSKLAPAATGLLSSAAAAAGGGGTGEGGTEGYGVSLSGLLRAATSLLQPSAATAAAAVPVQAGLALQLLQNWARGLRAGNGGLVEAVAGGVAVQLSEEGGGSERQREQQGEQAAQLLTVLWIAWLQNTSGTAHGLATSTPAAAAEVRGGVGLQVGWVALSAGAMGLALQQQLQELLPLAQPSPADATAMQEAASAHMPCAEPCARPLACGHSCSSRCHTGSPCGACKQPCSLRCQHVVCHLPCSAPCAPCAEPCGWYCEHQGPCLLPCGAPCDRLPCNRRCSNVLACGHQCTGLCGEVCPATEYCLHPDCRAVAPERVLTQVRPLAACHTCLLSLRIEYGQLYSSALHINSFQWWLPH